MFSILFQLLLQKIIFCYIPTIKKNVILDDELIKFYRMQYQMKLLFLCYLDTIIHKFTPHIPPHCSVIIPTLLPIVLSHSTVSSPLFRHIPQFPPHYCVTPQFPPHCSVPVNSFLPTAPSHSIVSSPLFRHTPQLPPHYCVTFPSFLPTTASHSPVSSPLLRHTPLLPPHCSVILHNFLPIISFTLPIPSHCSVLFNSFLPTAPSLQFPPHCCITHSTVSSPKMHHIPPHYFVSPHYFISPSFSPLPRHILPSRHHAYSQPSLNSLKQENCGLRKEPKVIG